MILTLHPTVHPQAFSPQIGRRPPSGFNIHLPLGIVPAESSPLPEDIGAGKPMPPSAFCTKAIKRAWASLRNIHLLSARTRRGSTSSASLATSATPGHSTTLIVIPAEGYHQRELSKRPSLTQVRMGSGSTQSTTHSIAHPGIRVDVCAGAPGYVAEEHEELKVEAARESWASSNQRRSQGTWESVLREEEEMRREEGRAPLGKGEGRQTARVEDEDEIVALPAGYQGNECRWEIDAQRRVWLKGCEEDELDQ